MTMFSIFTWDEEHGPIKSWDRMKGIEIHNGRVKPIDHGVAGAPKPEFLVGSPSIEKEARQRYVDHGLDPDKIRKEGVIGYEGVMSASAEFFASGNADDRASRMSRWKAAQVDFAFRYLGEHRVVSMVLHQDERTPHIHIVAIPLEFKHDGRSPNDPTPKWSINGQVLAARGRWGKLQTDYAKAMAGFGLSRGEEGSKRKHKTYDEVLAGVEADRAAFVLRTEALKEREREVDRLMMNAQTEAAAASRARDAALIDRASAAAMLTVIEAERVDQDRVMRLHQQAEQQMALAREAEARLVDSQHEHQRAEMRLESAQRDCLRREIDLATAATDIGIRAKALEKGEAALAAERARLAQDQRRAAQMDNGKLIQRAHRLVMLGQTSDRRREAQEAERLAVLAQEQLAEVRKKTRADFKRVRPVILLADAFATTMQEVDQIFFQMPPVIRKAYLEAKDIARRVQIEARPPANDVAAQRAVFRSQERGAVAR